MPADATGFFAVQWHLPAQRCPAPWRPMHELARTSHAWDDRIAETRAALALAAGVHTDDVEHRVAASVVHLGICARIIAPALAAAACDNVELDTALQHMWWQPALGGPFPLSMLRPEPAAATPQELIRRLRGRLVEVTLAALVQAVRQYSVSGVIAWGNAGSALHSAAALLRVAHPHRTAHLDAVVAGLTEYEPLSAAGSVLADGPFRRNSCCLIYRVAGERADAVCGDCVLRSTDHHTSPSRQSQVISSSRSSGNDVDVDST